MKRTPLWLVMLLANRVKAGVGQQQQEWRVGAGPIVEEPGPEPERKVARRPSDKRIVPQPEFEGELPMWHSLVGFLLQIQ